MKKKFRVVKNFKIVKQSCSLNGYYRVGSKAFFTMATLLMPLLENGLFEEIGKEVGSHATPTNFSF